MRTIYVLPGCFLAGGNRVVLEHVARLAARGYLAEAWYPEPGPGWSGPPPAVLGHLAPTREFPDFDSLRRELARTRAIKVATWWGTAAIVAQALSPGDRGFYLVQDIETSYAADTAEAERVLASYQLGLTLVTVGRWVAEQLRSRFGLVSRHVGIGLSHNVFHPDQAVGRDRSVLAQARRWAGGPNDLKDWPTTRAVLGVVAPARGGVEAVTFSSEPPPDLPGLNHTHVPGPTDAGLADLYRRAGVFLFGSRHEGFGLPAAEAMACGCPVVATRAKGNEEFCLPGETALMADPGDVAALAKYAREILDDPVLAARLAAAGRDRVQEYRWEPVIDRLTEALELRPQGSAVGVPAGYPTGTPARGGTVLLASALGGGLGHVVPLLRLADALAADGFAPAFAVRDLAEAWPVLGPAGYPAYQAPVYHPTPADRANGMLAGYVDVLALNGFRSADTLLPLVRAWDHLFAAVRPALVVTDHSPAAVVAAAGAVPVVQVGAGFELPPLDGPAFPRLLSDGVRVADESEVLSVVRAVQVARGVRPSDSLQTAFLTPRAVTVLPEFDPYQPVRGEVCVGPLTPLPNPLSPPPLWYFAYLNAAGVSDDTITALAGCGVPGAVYLRGVDPARAGRLRQAGVPMADRLRPSDEVLRGAAVVIHHGGVGTAQATLAAGRPQILVPEHLEHLLTAHLLDRLGVGVKLVAPTPAGLAAVVRQFASDPAMTARCRAVADGLRGRPDRDGLPTVLQLCRSHDSGPATVTPSPPSCGS